MFESLAGPSADAIRETTHRGLIFGTSTPYAMFHQKGTSNIPQREHVGINEEILDKIVEAVAAQAVEAMKAKS